MTIWPHGRMAATAPPATGLCVAAQGGPDPEAVFTAHPLGREACPAGVAAVLAGLAGYFVAHLLRPDPPGLLTLRAFQAAQGAAALDWLRRRSAGRRR